MNTLIKYKTSSGRRARINMLRSILSETISAEKGHDTVSYLSERETLDVIVDAVYDDLVTNRVKPTEEEASDKT